jgi:hypothetical protein
MLIETSNPPRQPPRRKKKLTMAARDPARFLQGGSE